MKLKDIYIDLVGAFDCTIENNVVLCTGNFFSSEPPHDTADLFLFNVIDPTTGSIKEGIVVVFKQVGDNIEFRYRKDVFDVISVTFDLITLRKDSVDYFIKRRATVLD